MHFTSSNLVVNYHAQVEKEEESTHYHLSSEMVKTDLSVILKKVDNFNGQR